jgi:arginine utilization protein RocB
VTEIGDKIKNVAIELTKIPSVVGTPGEIAVAEWIYGYLRRLDYFRRHPDRLRLLPVKGDRLGRKNVVAVIRGGKCASPRHLLCLGHIDTVGTDDYAELRQYATDPDALREKLPAVKFGEETLAEIASPDWLVGRGILDMKTGVAALMIMLEEFSRRAEELTGNLVFLGVPDEEGNSAGMLSAVQDLAEMLGEEGGEFIGAIDTDYTTGRYPGDTARYVYIGTTGKLLPCFYLYGEETHVGEAFNGLDANLLASEVLYQMDLSTDLCDIADGEVTLPPVSLSQRDLKAEYSVQTANAVNLYFNYATHISQPDEVLAKCKEKAVKSFENVIKRLNEEYEKYCSLSAIPFSKLAWEVNVLTYEELYRNVKREIGEELDRAIEQLSEKLRARNVDEREFSLAIVQEVHNRYADKNSKIIVYFAPPYYPHIYVRDEDEKGKVLLDAVTRAVGDVSARYDYEIVTKKFYPYISDLSYCGIADERSIARLTGNMPAWGRRYTLPVKAIQAVSMPVVNIGPYGKDAHKLSERVCTRYSFDAMPAILGNTITNLLIDKSGNKCEEEKT